MTSQGSGGLKRQREVRNVSRAGWATVHCSHEHLQCTTLVYNNGHVADTDVDQITDAVLTASRVLVAISSASLSGMPDGLTLPQYRALVVLQSRGPQTLQGLAPELDVVPSTATRMCDRLVGKGLISRVTGEHSRREVVLDVTEAGRVIVNKVTRRRRERVHRIVENLRPGEGAALVAALEDFARAAGEIPERQWYLGWT